MYKTSIIITLMQKANFVTLKQRFYQVKDKAKNKNYMKYGLHYIRRVAGSLLQTAHAWPACSHVGALLFKMQAGALLGINKIACTSKLCAWKRSRRFAEPALMTEIDFSRPKQKQTVPKEKKVVSDRMKKPISFRDPTHLNNEFHKQKLKELYTVNPDAAILTSLYDNDPEDFTVTNSETDTADETELNSIPEPLTSLFKPQLISHIRRNV
ncbi:uncharacterized protein LOC130648289 [Hydractinia symbiolongicarpus]|uniref:uncharacterized protein LOC130648289 n=1 Tax=Hydractinia symbiolongicarpus TaxID=13093 RepID=UPI00254C87AC|nr:uncharacterized protein LOC130648289 [Hydractinia symbiolongicarpus]